MSYTKFSLVGINGNAFSIVGYVRRCMKQVGFDYSEIEKYTINALSQDYNYVLVTSMNMIDRCNELYEQDDLESHYK